MTYTERELRTRDLGRAEPPADVLDRLAERGHARHGFCEKCWADAYFEAVYTDRLQGDVYFERLAAAEAAVR